MRARRDEHDVGVVAPDEVGQDDVAPGGAFLARAGHAADVLVAVDERVVRRAAAARRAHDRQVVAVGERCERRLPLLGVRVADERDRQACAAAAHAGAGGGGVAPIAREVRAVAGPCEVLDGRQRATLEAARRLQQRDAHEAQQCRCREPGDDDAAGGSAGAQAEAHRPLPQAERQHREDRHRDDHRRPRAEEAELEAVGQQRHEDDRRPVPQVQRVRQAPDRGGQARAHEALERVAAHEVEAGDQSDARGRHGDPRPARVLARVRDLVCEHDESDQRGGARRGSGGAQARARGRGRGGGRGPAGLRAAGGGGAGRGGGHAQRGDRERAAGEQLVGAGVRAVVRQRARVEQDRQGGGDGGQREHRAEQQPVTDGVAARARDRGPQPEQQRRPEDVELLLDAERPEVDQRAVDVARREVVDLRQGEAPVRAVQRGERRVVADRSLVGAVHEDVRRDDHDRDDERRGRQQPAHAARVEAREVDAAAAQQLVDEQARDEVARQHEEDVDADEPASRPAVAEVKDDHEDHGDSTDPVEMRAVGVLGGCGRRHEWWARR